jgi:hypothetical protein
MKMGQIFVFFDFLFPQQDDKYYCRNLGLSKLPSLSTNDLARLTVSGIIHGSESSRLFSSLTLILLKEKPISSSSEEAGETGRAR